MSPPPGSAGAQAHDPALSQDAPFVRREPYWRYMTAELTAVLGFAAGGAASLVATPLAISVARRTGFLDCPRGYRRHGAPTPFLGGAAVLIGFLVSVLVVGGVSGKLFVLIVCAGGLWLLGTIDDRLTVAPTWRLVAEAGAAIALFAAGIGWETGAGGGVDLVLTVIWIVGLVNAFNLMDNLDGACGTLGCVSALGIGVLAVMRGQPTVAGLAFGLAGACAAFLRWNLAGPAKIFLGDGGSMPVGFLAASLVMATAAHLGVGDASLLAGALMLGVTILDTTLVTVSRARRRVPLVTGGRDHLTHRLLLRLKSPRAVAAALAAAQALLCGLAIVGDQIGPLALAASALAAVLVGVVAIGLLDTARWRPAGIAMGRGTRGYRAEAARSVSLHSR
jgi:UDP-GlcNAc:undecaprenyl-phosphate/decaprenyl-phosphate GlcNAc-1-phosphate transferase